MGHRANLPQSISAPTKLVFLGIAEGQDVYNPTAPFAVRVNGRACTVMAARVEKRASEDSQIVFFEENGRGEWSRADGAPVLQLQDPFHSFIHGQIVVGGVQLIRDSTGRIDSYRSVFYRGTDLAHLELFSQGPDGMKDIRLVELSDRRVLVFTRPQGEVGGRGKIGYFIIRTLDQLNPDAIRGAAILSDLFWGTEWDRDRGEWGGVNATYLLPGGLVGVLGHIARFDERHHRHYYPIAFVFDPLSGRHTDPQILLERASLSDGKIKREDLRDVLFGGGLIRHNNGTATLYLGASDAESHRRLIADPFLGYRHAALLAD